MKRLNNQTGPAERLLARQILPSSGTMIGLCTTLIGLVKVLEPHSGPSRVDEYASLASLLFLTSAISAYIALRHAKHDLSAHCERVADTAFVGGLIVISGIALFFAYEMI